MTIKQEDFDKIVAKHMDRAMEQYVVSKYSEWSGLIAAIQGNTKEMKQDIKEIREQVQPLLSEAEFWEQFWKRVRQGGNILTWAVGAGLPQGVIDIDNSPKVNLSNIAQAKKCDISDLTVMILKRERQRQNKVSTNQ